MSICFGELSRPPPNNAGKAARIEFLNQHYINLAIDEIVRMRGRAGLADGMHLVFNQEGGIFSTPATTPETRLFNTHNFDRSEAEQAQTTFNKTNADYKVHISLVPAPHLSKNGYEAEVLKSAYRKVMSATIRNVKKREVREKTAKQMAKAEQRTEVEKRWPEPEYRLSATQRKKERRLSRLWRPLPSRQESGRTLIELDLAGRHPRRGSMKQSRMTEELEEKPNSYWDNEVDSMLRKKWDNVTSLSKQRYPPLRTSLSLMKLIIKA